MSNVGQFAIDVVDDLRAQLAACETARDEAIKELDELKELQCDLPEHLDFEAQTVKIELLEAELSQCQVQRDQAQEYLEAFRRNAAALEDSMSEAFAERDEQIGLKLDAVNRWGESQDELARLRSIVMACDQAEAERDAALARAAEAEGRAAEAEHRQAEAEHGRDTWMNEANRLDDQMETRVERLEAQLAVARLDAERLATVLDGVFILLSRQRTEPLGSGASRIKRQAMERIESALAATAGPDPSGAPQDADYMLSASASAGPRLMPKQTWGLDDHPSDRGKDG